MEERRQGGATHLVIWLLAFVAAVSVSVVLLMGGRQPLVKSSMIDSGEARTVTARMEVTLDTDEVDRPGSFQDRNGADDWRAEFPSDGRSGEVDIDGWFNVAGRGDVLHKWDGATVTCYLSGKHVIGVKLPDGTILKADDVGWHGALNTWGGGLFFAGVALLVGGIGLRWGTKAVVAGAVVVLGTILAAVHVNFLPYALAFDGVFLLVVVYAFLRLLRRARDKVAAAELAPGVQDPGASAVDRGPSLFD